MKVVITGGFIWIFGLLFRSRVSKKERDGRSWQRGGGRLNCRLEMRIRLCATKIPINAQRICWVPKRSTGLFPAVFLGVSFPCFLRMLSGMNSMPRRRVRMMGSFFVLPDVVMLGRFTVMAGRIRMMFRGLPMVLSCFL
jgi:hypothetical protein